MITSAANPRLKLVRRLAGRRQRDRLGLFVCEGEDLVAAALAAGIEPEAVLVDAERPPLGEELAGAEPVASGLLAEVSSLGHHGRVVAIVRRDSLPAVSRGGAGLGLWRVADPGNLGTLLRAADAFDAGFVALSPGCADPVGPKAVRASAGAIFRVPLFELDAAPQPWVALDTRGGEPLEHAGLPAAGTLLLGAEREGLPADVLERCERTATIPQPGGAESLNVAMAGTVALYEWRRQHPAT